MEVELKDSFEVAERSPKKVVKQDKIRDREPKKTIFTQHQTSTLEAEYAKNKYPSKEARHDLAAEFSMAENKIKIWFQNRRMKEKREKQTAIAQTQNILYRRLASGLDDVLRTNIPSPLSYAPTQSIPSPITPSTMLPCCYRTCCVPMCSPELTRYDTLSPSRDSPMERLTPDGAQILHHSYRPYPQDRSQRITPMPSPYGYLSPMRHGFPLSPLPFQMFSPAVGQTTTYNPSPLYSLDL